MTEKTKQWKLFNILANLVNSARKTKGLDSRDELVYRATQKINKLGKK